MERVVKHTLVIAVITLAVARPTQTIQQQLLWITDPDEYAVYAAVVPQAWKTISNDLLLLQQETEGIDAVSSCLPGLMTSKAADSEWDAAVNDFTQRNMSVHVLRPSLPIDIPYRLIPHAEILADDARLEVKYPGLWQHRPESMQYLAVSAVGFGPSKTNAIVYLRRRDEGGLRLLERHDDEWVPAKRGGCQWIA